MNKSHAKKIPDDWKGFSLIFSCLGDEERQRIVLAFAPGEELTATTIADASALSRPAVSHHLGILHRSGCLLREKRGREVFYSLNKALLDETFTRCLAYVRNVSAASLSEGVK